jgi:hypothetical protein
MGIFDTISNLRTNILGGGGVGTTTSISRQSSIEMRDTSPTSKLKKEPLDFSTLSYPKDLINDVTNGHYMLFYINVQNKTKFPYTRASDGVQFGAKQINTVEQTTETGAVPQLGYKNKVTTSYEDVTTGGGIQNAQDFFSGNLPDTNYSDVQTLRQDKTKMRTGFAATKTMRKATVRIKESIAIYLPPNVQDSYTTQYSGAKTALLGFMAASGGKFLDEYRKGDYSQAAELLKDSAGAAFTEMGKRSAAAALDIVGLGEGALGLGAKIFGATTNPYMEVLFGGVDLRTFTYNFTFAPKSKEERDEVQKIIHTFRFHQAPELRSNQSLYMGLPAEFDIHYMYQPESGTQALENPYYNKIATCVLTNVTVDYTPGGVYSHDDGSPVKIKMTLEFLETEMITKGHIEAGY